MRVVDIKKLEYPKISSYWIVKCLSEMDLGEVNCAQFRKLTAILNVLQVLDRVRNLSREGLKGLTYCVSAGQLSVETEHANRSFKVSIMYLREDALDFTLLDDKVKELLPKEIVDKYWFAVESAEQ